MNTFHAFAGLAAALLVLSACDSKSPESSAPATSSTATTVNTPPPGTIPEAVPGTGPGEGGTAIGGVVSNQDGSGASNSDAPASTGGDGSSTPAEK